MDPKGVGVGENLEKANRDTFAECRDSERGWATAQNRLPFFSYPVALIDALNGSLLSILIGLVACKSALGNP